MTETQFRNKTFRLLRGLRRPNPELDSLLSDSSQPTVHVPAPKRLKVVPVYGLPILCHCPIRGEFLQEKIIGHQIIHLEDGAGNSGSKKGVVTEGVGVKAGQLSDEDVRFYKKNDAYRNTGVSADTGKLTTELADSLKQYEDSVYKVLRGLRRLDEDLVKAYKTLCADSPVPRRPSRVRVVPTYGQPVLIHCARYGTFRQWKIVSLELVRPGQVTEEPVPEDVDDFVEVDEGVFPQNDEAYSRYKKTDTYEMPAIVENMVNADDASTADPVASETEVSVPHPQVYDDDDDMDGLFGVYAREH